MGMLMGNKQGMKTEEKGIVDKFNITSAVYHGQATITGLTSPKGFSISPDGVYWYVTSNSDSVRQYQMSTPWDMTTSSVVATESISAIETNSNGLYVSPDGLNLFTTNASGLLRSYKMSVAWDITTLTWFGALNVSTQLSGTIYDIMFDNLGESFFITNGSIGKEYINISGGLYSLSGKASSTDYEIPLIGNGEGLQLGLSFSGQGNYLYGAAFTPDEVVEYSLDAPFTFASQGLGALEDSFDVSAKVTNPYYVRFSPDGKNMYVNTPSGESIQQYKLTV